MNRKIISFAIAFLLCIGLCSAGFAAWVISSDASDTQNGTINVETVTDDRFTVSVSKPKAIVFGCTKQPVRPNEISAKLVQSPWLTSDESKTESLKVTINVTVQATKNNEMATPVVGDITLTESSTKYQTAKAAGYVADLPSTQNNNIKASTVTNEGNGKFTFTVDITFNWGTTFDSINPYFFYNQHEATDTYTKASMPYADHAAKHLAELKKLDAAQYTLTINVKHA